MKRYVIYLLLFLYPAIPAATVTFDGAKTYQVIEGFGVNANHRSWKNNELKPVLDALIDQAGMTLFRVVFDKTDWEASNDNADPSVMNWTYYNSVYSSDKFTPLWEMMAYLNSRGITNGAFFNFIGNGPLWMGASPLNAGMEDEWAEMIVSLLMYARNTRGLQFELVAPNNEPDLRSEGIEMLTASQYTTALHELAELLDLSGMSDVQLIGPDLSGNGTTYMPAMMADAVVMAKLERFGVHSYGGGGSGMYDYILNSAYPDRTFWITEFNVWCSRCDYATRGTYDWAYCRGTAAYLLNHLKTGASAGIVWEGYDSFYAHPPSTWSFWGLFGVDDEDATVKTYTPRKNFYTFAQVSKFVRPGARRVNVTGTATPFSSLAAFYHSGLGQITIVGVNTSSRTAVLDGTLESLPAVSSLSLYYTSATTNLAYAGQVTVDNEMFSATIPADCVFTLTGFAGVHVALTNPAHYARFNAPANISMTAVASASVGTIARVEFYNGLTKLGADTSKPYEYVWSGVPMGDYSLTARAIDSVGNISTSEAVNIVVVGSIAKIVIIPSNAAVLPGGTQKFVASAIDGLGRPLDPKPKFSWSVNGGGGVNRTGLFTAGTLGGGPFKVIVRSGDITGIGTVNVASITGWTIWPSTIMPELVDVGADRPIELGVKFRSDVTGTIAGIRFYKSNANGGNHEGNLWTSNGVRLATATFTNESPSQWQEAFFATPVTIASDTTYVASYHVNGGHYSADLKYFEGKGVDNPPLHALVNGRSEGNGVFMYGSISAFPTQSYNAANYWVDVLFDSGAKCQEPATNWYAGDMHVHRSCGGSPVSISSIYNTMVNQDLSVISLLADMGNGEVQNPGTDLPQVKGQNDSVSTAGRIVHWDTEWHWDAVYTQFVHQALGGHIVALGLTNAYQVWQEYTYPIFQWAHQQGGIAGFAHMQYLGDGFPSSLNCCLPIEYPVEVALGACDFISEDVHGSDTAIHAYYRLLNCGFRPGLAAGSDNPCGATIGSMLTYSRVAGGSLTYSNWIHAIAQGRTAISRNGRKEFLDLRVNGSMMPGDEIKLSGGGGVQVAIEWTATQSITGTIQLVKNGEVVASKLASASPGIPDSLNATVEFTNSGWLCARRMSGRGHEFHTAAIFVTVDDRPVRASVADAQFYVQWTGQLLTNTSPGGIWSSYFVTNRAQAQARYSAARGIYQQIAREALAQVQVVINTTSLPNGALNVAYSATLAASGGTTPYTWSIVSGSLPAGLTLNSSGMITGMPTSVGTFSFIARVTDSGNPAQIASNQFSITIGAIPMITIWPGTATPVNESASDASSVELGVKFRSDVNGIIHGIRFYKSAMNTNVHIGSLWTSNGTRLASATFNNETTSGWQQVFFDAPVTIDSNRVYVASYHAYNGHYSADTSYFATAGVDTPPLHALTNGVFGGNGVYAYGASSIFPNQTYNAANYWVDVLFQPVSLLTLTSIAVTPANPSIFTGGTQQFTATGTYSDGSTEDITSQAAWRSSNTGAVTIVAGGLATGISDGTAMIWAQLAGVTSSTMLTVQSLPLTITIGNTNEETNSDAIWSNGSWINANRFQAATNLTINTVFAKVTAISGKYKCAIYLEENNRPHELIRDSAEVSNPGNGWRAFPLTSLLALTNGHSYWLAIWSDDANSRVYYSAKGGTLRWLRYDYGAWPDPITTDGGNSLNYCIFATSITRMVPIINWPMPSEIVYGTPLGEAQLNATSSVAGTFIYDPPANTVLHAGLEQTLNTTFLPYDTNMYMMVTTNVHIHVQKKNLRIIANDTNKIYGAPLPTFTANYSGFVSGDNAASLTTPVTFSTIATERSDVGTYAIIPAGAAAENYTIEYRTGTLQIVPVHTMAQLISSANPASQGTQVSFMYRLRAMISGLNTPDGFVWFDVDGTNTGPAITLIDGSAVYMTRALDFGWHTVQAKYGGSLNFLGVTNRLMPDQLISISTPLLIANVGGSYLLRFGGIPDQMYRIEYTDSLVNPVWQDLGTCIANAFGIVEYLDYPPQNVPARYYHSTYWVKTIWPCSAVPILLDGGADNSLELGVKFRSDVNGTIQGIRFYKAAANTGIHIGSLWTSNGTLLAMATFNNETPSGWQQVFFVTPVSIASNTVYVASYHAHNGHYSFDTNYFAASGVDNPPLHALGNGVFGGNGVFAYGSSIIFPNLTWNAINYWVDVAFQTNVP